MNVDPGELQAVKDALALNSQNAGVGVLHEPTGQIRLAAPFDTVPGGHADLVTKGQWPAGECKGFVIVPDGQGGFAVGNVSHLNGVQGRPGSLQMPQATFDAIRQALRDAGL
jgi:hypothetical protein